MELSQRPNFMRIRVYSDLHLEFAPFEPPATDVDVVVLAGDIDVKGRLRSSAACSTPRSDGISKNGASCTLTGTGLGSNLAFE